MPESDAARILLVRSVEESGEGVFTPTQLAESSKAAGDFDNRASWFLKRATYLFGKLPAPYRLLIDSIRIVDKARVVAIVGALLLGVASNYFSPTGKIHIVFNPPMALVAWNLLIYFLLILFAGRRFIGRFSGRHDGRERRALEQPLDETGTGSTEARPEGKILSKRINDKPSLALRLIPPLGEAWLFLHARAWDVRRGAKTASGLFQTAKKFWSYWIDLSRKVLVLRAERVLHAGAIALTVGALVGMYFRGLVLDYEVVWRSTFIRDEKAIGFLISLVFGPAAWLSGIHLSEHTTIPDLMGPTGSPAALWIHLYAITAAVIIVLPRSILYLSDSLQIKRQVAKVGMVFDDDYYLSRIQDAIEAWKADALGKIGALVRIARTSFSESIASYVCERLYDARIVPAIDEFQQEGGSLNALEARIRKASEEFIPDSNEYTRFAQGHFEKVLSGSIEQMFGKRLAIDSDIKGFGEFGKHPGDAGRVVDSLGGSFTRTVGIAVSAAVAAVVGTVSGGFGKTLGTAILVALFHTTGPIGYVIGALAGLLMTYGAWYFGKQKIMDAVKQVYIPRFVVRMILWKSRLDRIKADGRAKTYAVVREELDEVLHPLDDKIADQIWRRIRAAVPSLH
jgi:hypothetical protein